jgi:hypothetical protein
VDCYLLQDVQVGEFTISATIKGRENGMLWTLTRVYGPQHDVDKQRFMLEMRTISTAVLPQWCILGDFNLIFRADQKSTGRVNRRLMNSFKSALDDLELKELHMGVNLHGPVKPPTQLSPKLITYLSPRTRSWQGRLHLCTLSPHLHRTTVLCS